MQQTLEQLDVAHLDFEPALPCDFDTCLSKHSQSAALRLLVGHTLNRHGDHGSAVVLVCSACYEWLVQNPMRLAWCPDHGDLGPLRDWWQLLGQV